MIEYFEELCQGYQLRTLSRFSVPQADRLVALCRQPVVGRRALLAGTNCISVGDIEGLGRVVVKHYRRGGVLSRFVSSTYLRWGEIRSRMELELLLKARELGVAAPRPVGFVVKGGLLYRTWLATEEIPDHHSLAEVALKDLDRAESLLDEVGRQIALLIQGGIYHIDLHPGNVLVDGANRIYIVDFDKAEQFRRGRNALRDLYLFRWRRAAIKHGLPETFSELMCLRLRSRFE